MWQTVVIIILCIVVYDLWQRVKGLQKYLESSKEITKFRIAPLGDFWDLPLIREAIGVPLHGELDKAQRAKLGEWAREHQKIFYQLYTFFPDKELLFSLNEWGGGFFEFPYKTTNIYSKELATTKDDHTIEFNIAIRWIKDIFPKQSVPVYVGYLKKSKFMGKDDEIVTLFQMPHAFINPTFLRDKKSQPIIESLEKHLGLTKKDDNDTFGDFTNDFGEKDWFTGRGAWHETKYYEIHYP